MDLSELNRLRAMPPNDGIDSLMAINSKNALARMARAHGWKGDDARTGKREIAAWIFHQADIQQPAQPELIEPAQEHTETMNAPERAQALQQPTDSKSAANATAVAQAIAAALASVKLGADPEEIRAIVRAELSTIQPARIVLNGDAPQIKIEDRTHPAFEKTLRAVRAGLNVLLVGPAGCGKTTLAHHIAKALGRAYGSLHCTAGASESQLTGWLLPVGEHGRFDYVASEFVTLYESGNSVFLLDEIDAADPNMLLVINSALANGALHVPQRFQAPHITRGKDSAIIAAANTYGTGADLVYAGRNQLDGATLDRFYVIEMDYDESLEHAIAGRAHTPAKPWKPAEAPTAQELADLGEWVNNLRTKAQQLKLRRVVSTRTIQKAIAARSAGIPTAEVKRDLLAGWTRDEIAKVEG